MRALLIFCATVVLSYSLVDFSNSALYDIFDFVGLTEDYDFEAVTEIQISKCDDGCLIFASNSGDTFAGSPNSEDPYAKNIFVYDNASGQRYSINELAREHDANQRKRPLTINAPGRVSVRNLNEIVEFKSKFSTILLYVVDKATAETISFEVYDPVYTKGMSIIPQSNIVTFLSAWAFQVEASATAQANSVTMRLAGFDNAFDNNGDGCPYTYKTPDGPSFPGFSLMTMPQILSFAIGRRENPITLKTTQNIVKNFDISKAGFVTSPGWNGCTKPNNGGLQPFRYTDALDIDSYNLISFDVNQFFNVHLEVLPHFDAAGHRLSLSELPTEQHPLLVTGSTPFQQFDFPSTNTVFVKFEYMEGDQGFLLRYSSTPIPKTTTKDNKVESSTTTTTKSPIISSKTTKAATRTEALASTSTFAPELTTPIDFLRLTTSSGSMAKLFMLSIMPLFFVF